MTALVVGGSCLGDVLDLVNCGDLPSLLVNESVFQKELKVERWKAHSAYDQIIPHITPFAFWEGVALAQLASCCLRCDSVHSGTQLTQLLQASGFYKYMRTFLSRNLNRPSLLSIFDSPTNTQPTL